VNAVRQTTDQMLHWCDTEIPSLRARIAVTYATIDRARATLGSR
jgi:hypothetical protein